VRIMSTMPARLHYLNYLINYLKDAEVFEFDINNFFHRLALQKYVFFAGFLGFNHGYEYNLYIRGPYSPALAKDYYALYNIPIENRCSCSIPGLDIDRLIKLVRGRQPKWLEVGATALSIWSKYRNRTLTMELTLNAKGSNREEVEDILKVLEETGILN